MVNYIEPTTKRRILDSAAKLFAEKGFTETSIRELAEVVGLNPASLYHHFPSKNALLEHMLEDYSTYNNGVFGSRDISGVLRANPTTDGILACMQTSFPPDRSEYYLQVLNVMMQEQFRNPIVREYMTTRIILQAEDNMKRITDELKGLGIIRQDCDPDYWTKAISSLFYAFATRMMLDIGDNKPEYSGMGMVEMIRYTLDMMLERLGVPQNA